MKKRIRTLIIILLQTFMLVRLSAQTSHTISGIVKDKEAAPISGVSIQVDGQKWKASTGKLRKIHTGDPTKFHHHFFLRRL